MRSCRAFLESLDLPGGDLHGLPESPKRFADGARYRVEIPSCEGPRCLEALLWPDCETSELGAQGLALVTGA